MATVTVVGVEDELSGWTPKGGGTNFSEVDEGVAGHDSGNTENTTTSANADAFELATMPGDFDAAIDYQIDIVTKQSGRVDDAITLDTYITDGLVAIDAHIDTYNLDAVTTYTEQNGAARANTDNKTAWDEYEVLYDVNNMASGMPDAFTVFVTAVEVVINYTPISVGGIASMRQLIGHGQGTRA